MDHKEEVRCSNCGARLANVPSRAQALAEHWGVETVNAAVQKASDAFQAGAAAERARLEPVVKKLEAALRSVVTQLRHPELGVAWEALSYLEAIRAAALAPSAAREEQAGG